MEFLVINIFSTLAPVKPAELEPIVGAVTTDGGWLRRPTWYEFDTPAGRIRMTVAGEEYWTNQRAGLKGYAANFLPANSAELKRFRAMVDKFASTYALFGDASIEPGDEAFALVERIAEKLRGVVFVGGGIVVPGQGMLFGPDAPAEPVRQSATEEQLQGKVRTSLDHPKPTQRQLQRREKNSAAARALGLPVMDQLPVIEDDAQTTPHDVPTVVRRLLCIVVCAIKAEKAENAVIEELTKRFQLREWFSPEEQAFLAADDLSDSQLAKFGWRYECAHVLLWYLGYEKALQPAHQLCDAKIVIGHVIKKSPEELIAQAKPRSVAELLDIADLYYRLHWATISLRLKNKRSTKANEEIVMERHYALNWLIRYQGAEWDEVQTDT